MSERLGESAGQSGGDVINGSRTPLPSDLPTFERQALNDTHCPNCLGATLESFYQVGSIPLHSCLLMNSREKAIAYPRGDMNLAFCRSCGFIANAAFDHQHNDYSASYEDTQGFSPTFNTFADGLACDLVDRNNLRGRTLLEIGCGKGEFLIQACTYGACRGIGFDPAYRRDRHASIPHTIEFHERMYDQSCADFDADCIICRHTLEHIADTLSFMRTVRANIGERDNVVLFFEVPDVSRQLSEGAFWDIFYEHCSYFSPGSLARLFRTVGFGTYELTRTYSDQYLVITATPQLLANDCDRLHPLEDDLDALCAGVESFRETAGHAIERWRQFVTERADAGKRIVLWGSGSKSVGFLATLRITREIEYVVDINPHRAGRFQPGLPQQIVSPEFLRDYQPDTVIVMNPIYLTEIAESLRELSVEPELIAV